jgi:beta-glucosidase
MTSHSSGGPEASGREQAVEDAVEAVLGRLGLDAKAALTAGADMWSLAADPGIGLGRLVMSDGPAGVRGERWTAEDPSLALPSPTALAASWDVELVREAGRTLAAEARRKGAHVLLAPTVNLHRTPRGGRHFEAYSEDPLLTGAIGAAFVRGVQDGGVAATPKHWVANDSETDRFTVNVVAEPRTLRELYMAPFEQIVRTARPWALMAAYNSVNGPTMSEHDELNNGVLRREWGFDGMLVSDWMGARDTVGAALGGLDVAMPGPATVYGGRLAQAVRDGRVPESAVDEQARRVLRLAARVGVLEGSTDVTAAGGPSGGPSNDGEALAAKVSARGATLLRNDGLLPLAAPDGSGVPGSIAVIGAAAKEVRIGGGGSAQVFPDHVVSPLEGLRARVPESTRVVYSVGADPRVHVPAAAFPCTAALRAHDGTELGTVPTPDGTVRWIGLMPLDIPAAQIAEVVLTGTLRPEQRGTHRLSVRGVGRFVLQADGVTLFDGVIEPDGGDPVGAFLSPPERVFELDVAAAEPVELSLRYEVPDVSGFAGFGVVSFLLGHGDPVGTDEELIERAAEAAAQAEVAVVVVGTTEEVESEGVDRTGLALPGRQDELVRRVAAANPHTVVVVNAGAPVLMPWRKSVAAVLLAWFPGQAGGAALADVLLGAEEPGGRLPTTWPAREEDCPVWAVEPQDGRLGYPEGLLVGYRAWDRRAAAQASAAKPAYGFGHGLGYTSWEYESVRIVPGDFGSALVHRVAEQDADPYAPVAEAVVRLRNSGQRPGREVVQLYLAADAEADDPERAPRQLAGFTVVEAAAGGLVEAVIPLPLRVFQRWGADGWELRTGGHTLKAAHSSGDVRAVTRLEVPSA